MAAVNLTDDLAPVMAELRAIRAELEALRADHQAEVVTEREAARRLGLSLRTVQRRVATGELASVKVGASRRVRLAGTIPPPASSE